MGDESAAPESRAGGSATTHLAEGLTLREKRRLKAAVGCFERAVSADPSLTEGWFWLAVTRDNRGQEADAIPAYRQALSLGIKGPTSARKRGHGWPARCQRPGGTPRRLMP